MAGLELNLGPVQGGALNLQAKRPFQEPPKPLDLKPPKTDSLGNYTGRYPDGRYSSTVDLQRIGYEQDYKLPDLKKASGNPGPKLNFAEPLNKLKLGLNLPLEPAAAAVDRAVSNRAGAIGISLGAGILKGGLDAGVGFAGDTLGKAITLGGGNPAVARLVGDGFKIIGKGSTALGGMSLGDKGVQDALLDIIKTVPGLFDADNWKTNPPPDTHNNARYKTAPPPTGFPSDGSVVLSYPYDNYEFSYSGEYEQRLFSGQWEKRVLTNVVTGRFSGQPISIEVVSESGGQTAKIYTKDLNQNIQISRITLAHNSDGSTRKVNFTDFTFRYLGSGEISKVVPSPSPTSEYQGDTSSAGTFEGNWAGGGGTGESVGGTGSSAGTNLNGGAGFGAGGASLSSFSSSSSPGGSSSSSPGGSSSSSPGGSSSSSPGGSSSSSKTASSAGSSGGTLTNGGIATGVGLAIGTTILKGTGTSTQNIGGEGKTVKQLTSEAETKTSNKTEPPPVTKTAPNCENSCLQGIANTAKATDNKVDDLGTKLQTLDLGLLAVINSKLGDQVNGGLSGKLNRIGKALQFDKIMQALTLITVLHNASMLSRSLAETLGSLTSETLAAIGIKTEEGSPIDVNEIIAKQADDFMKSILGAEIWNGTKQNWNKANRIISTASQIVWTVRSISDSTREVMEWTAENTGKIGNALKRFRVVGENAYKWMPEKVTAQSRFKQKIDRVTQGIDSLDDTASSLSSVIGEVRSVQEEFGELKEQRENFDKAVKEALPKDRPDNDVTKTKAVQTSAASVSPPLTVETRQKGDAS